MAAPLFQQFFKSKRRSKREMEAMDNLPPISDSDFELLFHQLMEGIAHGWHGERLVTFFQNLGKRGATEHWLAWIDRHESQLVPNKPDLILGSRTIFLGEQLRPKLATRKLGERFFEMGQRIANPNTALANLDLIWEYDGPDVVKGAIAPGPNNPATVLTPVHQSPTPDPWLTEEEEERFATEGNNNDPVNLNSAVTASSVDVDGPQDEIWPESSVVTPPSELPSLAQDSDSGQVEQLTLEELRDRLESDPGFREQIATQVGISVTGDTESLIQALTKGINPIALDEDNYKHWFYFGVEKADQGKLEEAIAAWDKCLTLKPDLSSAWHNRGSALGQLNRLDEAISSFERAIEYNPEDFQAWNDKGIALFRQQKLEEALYCWDKTISLNPNFYQAWFNKGCLYENQGKYDEAKDCYGKTLALEPNFELALSRKNSLEQEPTAPN